MFIVFQTIPPSPKINLPFQTELRSYEEKIAQHISIVSVWSKMKEKRIMLQKWFEQFLVMIWCFDAFWGCDLGALLKSIVTVGQLEQPLSTGTSYWLLEHLSIKCLILKRLIFGIIFFEDYKPSTKKVLGRLYSIIQRCQNLYVLHTPASSTSTTRAQKVQLIFLWHKTTLETILIDLKICNNAGRAATNNSLHYQWICCIFFD